MYKLDVSKSNVKINKLSDKFSSTISSYNIGVL